MGYTNQFRQRKECPAQTPEAECGGVHIEDGVCVHWLPEDGGCWHPDTVDWLKRHGYRFNDEEGWVLG